MKKASFFETTRSPYYIYSADYVDNVAGIKALHYLCHSLNDLGLEAYMVGCSKESDHLRTPLLRESDAARHKLSGLLPIIVYPETVSGNPLNFPYVVRWLLNEPGHLGGHRDFTLGEMIFAYSQDFVPEHWQMASQPWNVENLRVPTVDTSIFHNIDNSYNDRREGSCYYANKYLAKGGILTKHVQSSISVCQDVTLTQQEMADIFRKSEYLYCYELSAVITEATLCGCTVIMIPTPYLDSHKYQDTLGYGIAFYGDEEGILVAKKTVSMAEEDNRILLDYCWGDLNHFVEMTQAELQRRQQEGMYQNPKWIDKTLEFIANTHGDTVLRPKLRQSFKNKTWLRANVLSEGQATIMAEQMHHSWLHQPTFHLIMVLNHGELVHLPDTFESLQQQLYGAWGLSIISSEAQAESLTDLPENIEWIQLQSTLNEAINQTVSETGLDWIIQLMPGDKLLPHALWSFADCINQHSEYRFIYSDEMTNEDSPQLLFKPDFNLELLRSSSYLGRSAIISRDTFDKIGGYTGLAYVDITDLAFHVYETWGETGIGHIDDVLYLAAEIEVDSKIFADNELAVRVAHIDRQAIQARVSLLPDNLFKMNYATETEPLISVVMANKNNASPMVACLGELHRNTAYENYELLIVDQMSDIEDMAYIYQDAQELFGHRLRLLEYADANYSAAINYGVSQAKGDYVLVLSSMAEPVNESWMTEIAAIAQRGDTGVVGVKVVEESEPYKVIHAGGTLGVANDVSGLFCGSDYDDDGYLNRAILSQEYAFVSSAAFIVNKADFILVGGLDENELANTHYCITDFCLKIKERGYKNSWTPHAVVRQDRKRASLNNGMCDFNNGGAEDVVIQRWSNYIEHDGAYNRNLSLMDTDYSVRTGIPVEWSEARYGKPRIMAFPFSPNAVGEFRVRGPLNSLSKEGRIETSILPNHVAIITPFIPSKFEVKRARPNIVYLNYTLSDEHYTFLQWLKSETKVFIVFSMDDLITSLPKKNDARKLLYKDIRHRLRRTLALCDRLIVSTQPLADTFSGFCNEIIVVPNSIDMTRWSTVMPAAPQKRQKLRVGWAGGELHRGDLDIIVEVVKETAQQIDWVFMGMCPEGLKPYLHEFHAFTSFADYPEKMAELDLDLAIAPLEKHPFNEAKSNLRLLEYGMLGWPVICTDIYPYQTMNPPVTRVNNTKQDWLNAISTAILKPEKLQGQGLELRRWVLSNYTLDQHINAWFEALTER